VINMDVARFMHRHGDDWVEMSPVPVHSPDSRDPERHLIHGERIFRCNSCDEEVSIQVPEQPHP
jgi:hypothetical protein